jgi:hypothetical protein
MIGDWRQNQQLVAEMHKVASQPIWRAFLEMMRNSSPAETIHLPTVGTTTSDRSNLQTLIEGYHLALSHMEMASDFELPESPMPQSTFEPEELE